jgi:two-component system chemotaxis sensor kinase CheA
VRVEAAARDDEPIAPIVDEMFRHAHSVKGMSASMELDGIQSVAHLCESLLEPSRRAGTAPDPGAVDLLLEAVDVMQGMVDRAAANDNPPSDPGLLARLQEAVTRVLEGKPVGVPIAPPPASPPPTATAGATGSGTAAEPPPRAPARRRVAVEVEIAGTCPVPAVRGFLVLKKLSGLGSLVESSPAADDLKAGRLPDRRLHVLLDTAEPAAALERALALIADISRVELREAAPAPPAAPAPAPAASLSTAQRDAADGGRTVRVRVDLLDSFLDAVGELILATARIRELGKAIPEAHRPPLDEGVDRLQATVMELHDKVMAVRMTPLRLVTDQLPRAARDLARKAGKQVEVDVQGAEIEIDRAILDELADPLVHVIRNAVDHGIEAPHLRLLAGKPATGRVTVSARRERDRVIVEIADDGRGMDPAKLRARAVARGALSAEAAAALGDPEALLLCCLPGVSTADQVTEVSGRGVGMDAVKRVVEAVGGALEIESEPGRGSRIALRLPLTVAVQQVLLVRVGEEVLGLPIAKVHGAAQAEVDRLERSRGEPMLPYGGGLVPVRDLAGLLGLPRGAQGGVRQVVVTDGEGARVGLAVDALLGQEDAVLKPLTRPLSLVSGLSAVTVLGNGRPVFILDVPRLGP